MDQLPSWDLQLANFTYSFSFRGSNVTDQAHKNVMAMAAVMVATTIGAFIDVAY
jgi:hypothetical protein